MRRFITVTPRNARKSRAVALSAADFCVIWQTSKSVDEVAARAKLKVAVVQQRARIYMKRGVALKTFPFRARGNPGFGKRLDVEGLNAVLDTMRVREEG